MKSSRKPRLSLRRLRPSTTQAVVCLVLGGVIVGVHLLRAQSPQDRQRALDSSFQQTVKPFLQKNCRTCHNPDMNTAALNVDRLEPSLEESQLKTWEAIRARLKAGTMPPKGMPQPTQAERDGVVDWITDGLEFARVRPVPQYRNTLKELLKIDDDVTAGLPPDAVSKEGFLNNKDQLNLSPLLTEAYFEIAENALNRAIF